MNYRILLFALSFALLTGCVNTAEKSADDMADFADDPEFKEAHDDPRAAAADYSGEMIDIPVEGGDVGSAYALMAESESDEYLLVFHEWWGLNDNIKEEAERLYGALDNVNVLALDLYDGKVATNPDQAGKIMQSIKEERARAIIQGALTMAGPEAEISTIGWCFGGGWSLKASIMAKDRGQACVMYYGMPVQKADQLAPLEAPILGIFAEKDGWITPEVANDFKALAEATGKSIEIRQFEADHAFANPSNPAYNESAAQEANALALAFLKEHM
ncbi:MAG TPA: dienelactone hydrolase family protein [Saprospiraceae bacterium]|nr:dienelactone hydrolase family protein [Saprospiraceae bacterium]